MYTATTEIYTLSLHDALPISWSKKQVRAVDVVKPGDRVEVVVLGVNPADKRIALGLKQALGDPWEDAVDRKSTRLNSSHPSISYAVFCLKKKNKTINT